MEAYQLTRMQRENIMVAKKIANAEAHKIDLVLKPGQYRTRDGRKAHIVGSGVPGDYPLIGYIEGSKGKMISTTTWRTDGTGAMTASDLVSIWSDARELTIDVYVGLDSSGSAVLSYNKPKDSDFIGLKKISVTVKEGDKV